MGLKKHIFRGWFPQEPTIGIIKSASLNQKLALSVTLPIMASGALMIVAAVLSAYFGFNLVGSYRTSLANGRFVSTDYASLYVALLSFVAFGLDLVAALLLVLRKYVSLAEILVSIVLACGLATPWIFTYYHSPLIYMYWESFLLQGLLAASPMIAFSLVTLILARFSRKHLNQETNMRWCALPFWVSGVLMIIASIPFAYESLYFLWLITLSGSALSSYIPAFIMILLYLLGFGLYLFLASQLLKRKRVGLVTVILAIMIAIGLPLQLFLLKGSEDPHWAFDSPTIACSIATLIIVGLNYRKFKQEASIKAMMRNSKSQRVSNE